MKYLLLFMFLPLYALADIIYIGPGPLGDFPSLEFASGFVNPGDTVIVRNGIYQNGSQFLYDWNGTEGSPILIMAEAPDQVIFRGGTEAIHLVNCSWLILEDFIIEQQTGNGINIDDGGDYSTPTHHITVRDCTFRDMDASGNNDFLKLSGLDDFIVENCNFTNGGAGGSGIDMVGCHRGVIQSCTFDNAGVTGIQAKGGAQHIVIRRNQFENISQRAINIGGSTGLQYFRPPLSDPIENAFESANIDVYSNIFIGNWAPIAFVGTVNSRVFNNTFYKPENWVFRILQETTVDGFLSCADNEFFNNIIFLEADLTEVNIGPNTAAETFSIHHNTWFNESSSNWSPNLPVVETNQNILNPDFTFESMFDFHLNPMSPCIGIGSPLNGDYLDFDENDFADVPSVGAFEGAINVSINAVEDVKGIQIYPNPVIDELWVSSEVDVTEIRLLNSKGRTVAYFDSVSKLSLQELSPGVYLVQCFNAKSELIQIKRIIKI